MGDEIRVPDKKGLVLPVALLGLLFAVLTCLGGLLFRAGSLVTGQERQNAEWDALRTDIKGKLQTVDELRGSIAQLQAEQLRFQTTTGDVLRVSLDKQSQQGAKLDALGEEIRRQERDRRLLQDYVEGRIADLPYRKGKS